MIAENNVIARKIKKSNTKLHKLLINNNDDPSQKVKI